MPYRPSGSSSGRSGGFENALAKQAAKERAARKKAEKDDGGGILGTGIGPDIDLGIEEVGRDIAGFIPGAFETFVWRPTQAVWHTAKGDFEGAKHDLEMEARAGKGVLASVAGTNADLIDLVGTASGINKLTELATGKTPGDWSRELTGEILGGEPDSRGGGNAYTPKPFLERAKERGLLSPALETVGNVALVTEGAGAAASAAGKGARAVGAEGAASRLAESGKALRESPMAHPLRQSYTNIVRPFTRAAFERSLGPLEAADDVVPVGGVEPTTKMQGLADQLQSPIDKGAEATMAKLDPEGRTVRALSWLERQSQARAARIALNQLKHMSEADRNALLHDPAVQEPVAAARKLIEEGGVKPDDANLMVGDELAARISGVAPMFADAPEAVRGALEEVGSRQSFIPDELRSPELDALLDRAVSEQGRLARERIATLQASRPGDRGLERIGADAPDMTRAERALLRLAEGSRSKAAELRERVPAEAETLQRRIDAAEAQSAALGERIAGYQDVRNAAAERLSEGSLAPPQEGLGRSVTEQPGGQRLLMPEQTTAPTPGTARQQAARAAVGPEETAAQALRRGRRLAYDVDRIEQANRRIAAKIEARRVVDESIADMKATLAAGELPSAQRAAMLDARAERSLLKLGESLDKAPYSRWPARWQPLGHAVQELGKLAEQRPELAQYLEEVPKTFTQVVQRAQELGFDPEHVRNFRPDQVRRLIYDSVRLGNGGELGKEILAGTRKSRRYNTTGVERSIESLAAAAQEATHELRTNQLVDFVERNLKRPVPADGVLPRGMAAWDPVRQFLLTGEKEGKTVVGQSVRYMVPSEVKTTLYRMTQDFNHGLFRGIAKVTNPWRAFVLTLSPRWYVNNFIGNLVLATAEGVRMADWRAAWDSFKKQGGRDGRFADIPAVRGHSMVSDIGEPTIIPNRTGIEGIKDAWASGETKFEKVGNVRRQVAHGMRRANEAVDEFARAAVYHKTMRTTGSSELALERAAKALIDYSDLSPFEQQAVRAVVPFYSWQKGILKVVAKMPVDHPAAMAVVLHIGSMQEDLLRDRFGGLVPIGYAGLLPIGEGAINTRGLNPFADSLSLTTVDGIAGSLNPFIESGLRKVLNAPDQGYADSYRMNDYGLAVPDVKSKGLLGDMVQGLPLSQLGMSFTGDSKYGPGQATERFFGIPWMTDADLQRAIDRARKARVRMGLEKAPSTKSPFRPL